MRACVRGIRRRFCPSQRCHLEAKLRAVQLELEPKAGGRAGTGPPTSAPMQGFHARLLVFNAAHQLPTRLNSAKQSSSAVTVGVTILGRLRGFAGMESQASLESQDPLGSQARCAARCQNGSVQRKPTCSLVCTAVQYQGQT